MDEPSWKLDFLIVRIASFERTPKGRRLCISQRVWFLRRKPQIQFSFFITEL